MKTLRKMVALPLLLAFCVLGVPQVLAAEVVPSDWAEVGVSDALRLDFIPEHLQSDYQKPITRLEFAHVAVSFCAVQYRIPQDSIYNDYTLARGYSGNPQPFSDCFYMDVFAAYELGVVEGRGNGIFDPDAPITRQEAATMLIRAYRVYGGDTGNEFNRSAYKDISKIADWAIDGVSLMSEWGVMNGVGDNTFSPNETYTREQCYITFLRLYKNAPVSRMHKNVQPLFTPDEYVDIILSREYGTWYDSIEQIETDDFIILGAWMGGLPHGNFVYSVFVLYKDATGGRDSLSWGNCTLDNFEMDENGYTLYCTVTYLELVKEIAIDLNTCKYEVVRVVEPVEQP